MVHRRNIWYPATVKAVLIVGWFIFWCATAAAADTPKTTPSWITNVHSFAAGGVGGVGSVLVGHPFDLGAQYLFVGLLSLVLLCCGSNPASASIHFDSQGPCRTISLNMPESIAWSRSSHQTTHKISSLYLYFSLHRSACKPPVPRTRRLNQRGPLERYWILSNRKVSRACIVVSRLLWLQSHPSGLSPFGALTRVTSSCVPWLLCPPDKRYPCPNSASRVALVPCPQPSSWCPPNASSVCYKFSSSRLARNRPNSTRALATALRSCIAKTDFEDFTRA